MPLLTIDQVHHVAVDEMQHTHEEEISMLNEIDALATIYENDKTKHATLEAKLEAYIQHVKEHFANEERLMRLYAFPPYQMHKAEHDRVLHELNHFTIRWKQHGELDAIIAYLRQSVDWIINHIHTMDNMTAMFISQQMYKN
ncbi:bacteriohemerythrin [Sulfurovum sp. TSL6]|uniref:bacteriohemerythrin n=1 Tax=Sulfurovum sp. TSL6 TaxID=2826995 RepID=UPI001CC6ACFB|nr:hemerythrin family protein [Sulfurovum sp. TSL6]GIU01513.1 bacteriohemerythrin [Sulfurovum sp. TSL6]